MFAHDPDLLAATGLDPIALSRQQRRLLKAGETPWLNRMLAARLAERLDWIKVDVSQALLWQALYGGGSEALRARYPKAELLAVEDAAAPLLEARRRRSWKILQRRDWAAPEQLQPGQAQLLWAPLSLHAAPNLRALLARWHELLAVDGFLMASGFGPDSFVELRRLYAAAGFGELAPAWVDLHDLGDLLVESGFAEPVMDQERLTLTWGDADALWRDLAALGGNLHRARFAGLRTPRWRERWAEALEGLRDRDGRLALTLEFVGAHAIKPLPKLRVQGETTVSLERLRSELRKPQA